MPSEVGVVKAVYVVTMRWGQREIQFYVTEPEKTAAITGLREAANKLEKTS